MNRALALKPRLGKSEIAIFRQPLERQHQSSRCTPLFLNQVGLPFAKDTQDSPVLENWHCWCNCDVMPIETVGDLLRSGPFQLSENLHPSVNLRGKALLDSLT